VQRYEGGVVIDDLLNFLQHGGAFCIVRFALDFKVNSSTLFVAVVAAVVLAVAGLFIGAHVQKLEKLAESSVSECQPII
jgi:ribosome-associated toxin RatA of RatAB toxin-antitoxin module